MRILYGTTNQAKLEVMREATKSLGIEVIGLSDLKCELPVVNENGKTPLENAQIKAEVYYHAFHMPVCSCDSGLYFDELEEDKQPGIYVRRVDGKELTDDEMVLYYGTLATEAFLLVSKPHSKRVLGFPLDSLSKDIKSGMYYYDLEEKEVSTSVEDGIREFFVKVFAGERM